MDLYIGDLFDVRLLTGNCDFGLQTKSLDVQCFASKDILHIHYSLTETYG